jgi:hypothetical protein
MADQPLDASQILSSWKAKWEKVGKVLKQLREERDMLVRVPPLAQIHHKK